MASDVRAYLPSYDVVTVYHLRDLVATQRKIIKCADVKVLQVPYFEGLSIKEMLDWAKAYKEGMAMIALPAVEKEIEKLPRAYIANCIYTMAGEDFADWGKRRVEVRNEKVTQQKDLAIKMDPEIAAIYQRSTAVSCKYQFSVQVP